MRIKSSFVDADGERKLDTVIPKNDEGIETLEKVWIRSLRKMLMDALKCDDDVEIEIKRKPGHNKFIV